ncbi:zinc-binding dehydrogenase [Bacillus sp. IB182487]|uniref:Zinc-binding dehydrogenase n=1 Tax=Metabacillus arenae TaxID=2771434 RepID=A0A926RW58_9BACI|nr:zinc-binding dehydrogenase [Metabacillus arenae]
MYYIDVLVIGGVGGVGSIAIQLAKLAGLTVISTASRQESIDWCKKLGSDYVINHYKPFVEQLEEINLKGVDYIFCLNNTDQHWDTITTSINPQGKICSIVETEEKHDLNLLKSKSAAFVWEFMFTRAMYQTKDMQEQHKLLSALSELIDQKKLVTTLTEVLTLINADNLKKAHIMVESGKMIGKVVVEYFE